MSDVVRDALQQRNEETHLWLRINLILIFLHDIYHNNTVPDAAEHRLLELREDNRCALDGVEGPDGLVSLLRLQLSVVSNKR